MKKTVYYIVYFPVLAATAVLTVTAGLLISSIKIILDVSDNILEKLNGRNK